MLSALVGMLSKKIEIVELLQWVLRYVLKCVAPFAPHDLDVESAWYASLYASL